MKKYLISFAALAMAFVANADPVSWIFDYAKYGTATNITWSSTLGTVGEAGSGYWYYMDADGETKHYIEGGSISSADTLTIGDSSTASTIRFVVDQDVSVASMNISSAKTVAINGSSNDLKFDISGDVTNNSDFNFSKLSLTIGGTVLMNVSSGSFRSTDMGPVNVGSVTSTTNKRYYFSSNSLVLGRKEAGTDTFANGIANPDVYVGYAALDGLYIQNIANRTTDHYYAFAGLNGIDGITSEESNSNFVTNIILKNTNVGSVYSATYGLREFNTNVNTVRTQYGKYRIVMNGLDGAIQRFTCPDWATGMQMYFSGGITMISGTLRIRFNQKISVSTYSYKTAATNRVYFTSAASADADRVQFSHGDLIMEGGEFASTDDFGAFRFTNIIYSGGKIALRLKNASSVDSLDLTSYYQANATIVNGATTVAEEIYGDISYDTIAGGKLSLSEKAAVGTKVTFRFEGDTILSWLLDDGDGTFDINGGKGAKIISWDASNKTDLLPSDFAANRIESGDEYDAVFTVADDGLYVRYMVVPEPAEWAAIFGAAAMLLAVYRRRK